MNPEPEIDQDTVRNPTNYYTINEFNSKFNLETNIDPNLNVSIDSNNSFEPTDQYFSLLHFNIRSMNKNFESVNLLLSSVKNFPFSVIGMTETWLHKNSPPIFNIDNYKFLRADRRRRRGGGVALYVHNSFPFNKRNDLDIPGTENLFIELQNDKEKNCIIGVIYRPPNTSIDSFLENLEGVLNTMSHENKPIYIMGDYNIDILPHKLNNVSLKFLNTLSSYSFLPHINEPTRITNTCKSLIDNIFSNVINTDFSNGILYSDVSDHLPIFIISRQSLNITNKRRYVYQRKETKRNVDKLNTDLACERWTEVFLETDPNLAYDLFINKLLFLYNKNIPLVKTKKNKRKSRRPWITKGILHSLKTRNKLYKIALESRSNLDFNKYKKYRNLLTMVIRLSRKLYHSKNIDNNRSNTNSLWSIVNDLLGKKKSTCTKIIENDQEITEPVKIANSFNNYFTNIGPTLASTINEGEDKFSKYLSDSFHNSLFFSPTSYHEVVNIVKELKSSRSSGYDGISVNLLKQIIHSIASPLTHIFNKSLASGRCPNSLKIAKVIPIFKKDNQYQLKNYRPISLLPGISKILEKIVYNRLFSFLNMNELLIPNQFGFRKKSLY